MRSSEQGRKDRLLQAAQTSGRGGCTEPREDRGRVRWENAKENPRSFPRPTEVERRRPKQKIIAVVVLRCQRCRRSALDRQLKSRSRPSVPSVRTELADVSMPDVCWRIRMINEFGRPQNTQRMLVKGFADVRGSNLGVRTPPSPAGEAGNELLLTERPSAMNVGTCDRLSLINLRAWRSPD